MKAMGQYINTSFSDHIRQVEDFIRQAGVCVCMCGLLNDQYGMKEPRGPRPQLTH